MPVPGAARCGRVLACGHEVGCELHELHEEQGVESCRCGWRTEQTCFCGQVRMDRACADVCPPEQDADALDFVLVEAEATSFSCEQACPRACDACLMPCELTCHDGPCPPCKRDPAQAMETMMCGCGTASALHAVGELDEAAAMQLHKRLARRSTCVAPLPSCGRHCGHMMPCGQHPCKRKCHDRLNSPCESRKCHTKVAVACDCDAEEFVWLPCWKAQLVLSLRAAGDRQWRRQLREDALRVFDASEVDESQRDVARRDLALAYGADLAQHEAAADAALLAMPAHQQPRAKCKTTCDAVLSCGRHYCDKKCCTDSVHQCKRKCKRKLGCGVHACTDHCHHADIPCSACPVASDEPLVCACGATGVPPPVPCGTVLPPCPHPCARPRDCEHECPNETCHKGECPPCRAQVQVRCHGDHQDIATVCINIHEHPERLACSRRCGKVIASCGAHKCKKRCHAGTCAEVCVESCAKPLLACPHACPLPCHGDSECPPACDSDTAMLELGCPCGNPDTRTRLSCRDLYSNARERVAAMLQGEGTEQYRVADFIWPVLECTQSCLVRERDAALRAMYRAVGHRVCVPFTPSAILAGVRLNKSALGELVSIEEALRGIVNSLHGSQGVYTHIFSIDHVRLVPVLFHVFMAHRVQPVFRTPRLIEAIFSPELVTLPVADYSTILKMSGICEPVWPSACVVRMHLNGVSPHVAADARWKKFADATLNVQEQLLGLGVSGNYAVGWNHTGALWHKGNWPTKTARADEEDPVLHLFFSSPATAARVQYELLRVEQRDGRVFRQKGSCSLRALGPLLPLTEQHADIPRLRGEVTVDPMSQVVRFSFSEPVEVEVEVEVEQDLVDSSDEDGEVHHMPGSDESALLLATSNPYLALSLDFTTEAAEPKPQKKVKKPKRSKTKARKERRQRQRQRKQREEQSTA